MSIRIFSVLAATIALVGSAGAQAQESSNEISSPPQFGEYVQLTNQVTAWHPWLGGYGGYVQLTNAVTYQATSDGYVIVNASNYTAYEGIGQYSTGITVHNYEISLGTNTNNLDISFKWDVGADSSITTIPIPSGYFFRVNGNKVYWLPINNQPSTNSSWIASDNSFLSAISDSLPFTALQSGIAQQGVNLSNAIASVSTQFSPSNSAFVSSIVSNGAFVSTLSTNADFVSSLASNPAFLNAIAIQILNHSNNYGIVVRQNQTLNFPAITPITYSNNSKITLSATSSSGLTPVTYSIANTSVATIVSNNILLINGAGSTTVTASQVGNPVYYPVSATQTLTVNPITQTISFPAIAAQTLAKTAVLTLSATSSAKLPITYIVANTAIATNRSSNSLTLLGVGTTTVTATNAGTQNYTPVGAVQTLIVK